MSGATRLDGSVPVGFNGDDRFRLIEIGGIATGKQAGCELVGNGMRQGNVAVKHLAYPARGSCGVSIFRQLRQGFQAIVFGFEQGVT